AVESNGELDLRQLHEPIPARRSCGRQRDDDVAVRLRGQKQRAQLRRIIAADCQRVSRFDPVLRQSAEPSIAAVAELAERPTLVAPNQRWSVPPRLQSLSHPMTAHDRPPLPLCFAIQKAAPSRLVHARSWPRPDDLASNDCVANIAQFLIYVHGWQPSE